MQTNNKDNKYEFVIQKFVYRHFPVANQHAQLSADGSPEPSWPGTTWPGTTCFADPLWLGIANVTGDSCRQSNLLATNFVIDF